MIILITGGTGLLGKALVEKNKDLYQIWAIYLGNYNMSNGKKVMYFNVNICNKDALEDTFFEAKPKACYQHSQC